MLGTNFKISFNTLRIGVVGDFDVRILAQHGELAGFQDDGQGASLSNIADSVVTSLGFFIVHSPTLRKRNRAFVVGNAFGQNVGDGVIAVNAVAKASIAGAGVHGQFVVDGIDLTIDGSGLAILISAVFLDSLGDAGQGVLFFDSHVSVSRLQNAQGTQGGINKEVTRLIASVN